MPKDSDKKVTIYVVHTAEDEDDEDIIQEDDDDDSDDDGIFIQKDYPTRAKAKVPKPVPKVEKIPVSKRFHINKGQPITNLKSLIQAFDHPKADAKQKELVENLKDLDSMIGMDKFKEQIINQILFFVQDMHDSQTFLHTVITGPPGTGKTRAINILAKIYCKLGILGSDKVVKADRASLIGKWCGHTAIKTKEVLESAKGGVLVLDEVYSLGNKDNGDSFSKECIDTLNQYLSEHVDDFVCVIAGYKDLVQECFFAANPGLERRFPWRFAIDPYTPDELTQIFKTQINECGWKLESDVTDKFITDLIRINKECFSGNGGDTRNLIDRCKIINARRVFTENAMIIEEEEEETPAKKKRKGRKFYIPPPVVEKVKIISKNDLDSGIKIFADSKKESKAELPDYIKSLYS
jgi:SpoVK/Ycf46/Vps4 family AAA+-type ATPase